MFTLMTPASMFVVSWDLLVFLATVLMDVSES